MKEVTLKFFPGSELPEENRRIIAVEKDGCVFSGTTEEFNTNLFFVGANDYGTINIDKGQFPKRIKVWCYCDLKGVVA